MVPIMACRRQAIIWTNAGILSYGPLGTKLQWNHFIQEMHLKMSSGKWRPFCLVFCLLLKVIPSFFRTSLYHIRILWYYFRKTTRYHEYAVTWPCYIPKNIMRHSSLIQSTSNISWQKNYYAKKHIWMKSVTWKCDRDKYICPRVVVPISSHASIGSKPARFEQITACLLGQRLYCFVILDLKDLTLWMIPYQHDCIRVH